MRYLLAAALAIMLALPVPFAGPLAASRCLDVSKEMVAVLEDGFEMAMRGQWQLKYAQAVRSKSFKKLYFISAEIEGKLMERKDDIGTWASNSLQPGAGMILSVSALAKEFSVWPDGSKTRAEITMFEDGAAASRDCVRRLIKRGTK
jgi:hypothetical protein